MEGRGRRSGAALTVVSGEGIVAIGRPESPDYLSDEQAEEWRAVVTRMPADWFPSETHSMLAQYCRHVVSAKRISQLVEALEKSPDFNVGEYDKLLKMHDREGRALALLATRMRITQQSTYSPNRQKNRSSVKPWESK